MTDRARHDPPVTPAGTSFASAALLRPITIDELSTVRHLHLMSARRLSASHLSEAELQAFCDHINSDPYTDRLIDQVRQGRLIAATLMDEIVATAGWIPANDSGATARMMAIFVAPLYALHGLGRLVVEAAEAQAAHAGFRVFTHRAPIGDEIAFPERQRRRDLKPRPVKQDRQRAERFGMRVDQPNHIRDGQPEHLGRDLPCPAHIAHRVAREQAYFDQIATEA